MKIVVILLLLACTISGDVIISPRRPHKNPADAEYVVAFTPHFSMAGKALVLFGDAPQDEEIRGSIIPPNREVSLTIVTYYPEEDDSLVLHSAYLLIMDSSEFRKYAGDDESFLINRQKLWEMGALDIRHLFTQQDLDELFEQHRAVFDRITEHFAVLPQSSGGYYLFSAGFTYSIEGDAVKTVKRKLPTHQPGGEKKKVTQESGLYLPPNTMPAAVLAAVSLLMALGIAAARSRQKRKPGRGFNS